MTSKESSPNIETVKPKKKELQSGGNGKTYNEYLDEILRNNNLQMELAMQIISNDKNSKK